MAKEYHTISQIAGPLVFVEKTEPVSYGELVGISLPDGSTKRGQVLEPVDKNQTSPWKHPVAAAFRFTRRPLELDYRLRNRPVRLDGELRLAAMVAEEDVRLGAFVAVHSTGAPTFRLAATLPEGYRLDGVHALYGPGIKDWWEEGEGAWGRRDQHP